MNKIYKYSVTCGKDPTGVMQMLQEERTSLQRNRAVCFICESYVTSDAYLRCAGRECGRLFCLREECLSQLEDFFPAGHELCLLCTDSPSPSSSPSLSPAASSSASASASSPSTPPSPSPSPTSTSSCSSPSPSSTSSTSATSSQQTTAILKSEPITTSKTTTEKEKEKEETSPWIPVASDCGRSPSVSPIGKPKRPRWYEKVWTDFFGSDDPSETRPCPICQAPLHRGARCGWNVAHIIPQMFLRREEPQQQEPRQEGERKEKQGSRPVLCRDPKYLLPICVSCNNAMGTGNLLDFVAVNYPNNLCPIVERLYKLYGLADYPTIPIFVWMSYGGGSLQQRNEDGSNVERGRGRGRGRIECMHVYEYLSLHSLHHLRGKIGFGGNDGGDGEKERGEREGWEVMIQHCEELQRRVDLKKEGKKQKEINRYIPFEPKGPLLKRSHVDDKEMCSRCYCQECNQKHRLLKEEDRGCTYCEGSPSFLEPAASLLGASSCAAATIQTSLLQDLPLHSLTASTSTTSSRQTSTRRRSTGGASSSSRNRSEAQERVWSDFFQCDNREDCRHCPICQKELKRNDCNVWARGHIVASTFLRKETTRQEDETMHPKYLVPICVSCNSAMGTKNMLDFVVGNEKYRNNLYTIVNRMYQLHGQAYPTLPIFVWMTYGAGSVGMTGEGTNGRVQSKEVYDQLEAQHLLRKVALLENEIEQLKNNKRQQTSSRNKRKKTTTEREVRHNRGKKKRKKQDKKGQKK
ncbi:SH3 domain-containing protein [Balamuthia mandrillaris]